MLKFYYSKWRQYLCCFLQLIYHFSILRLLVLYMLYTYIQFCKL
uniref:Uncharacterized protein n=1 Tax=Anguilla anguilla TaxID=7936 RepID=A0A0E9PBQ6_ANGAN